MWITVLDCHQAPDGQDCTVHFSTQYGRGVGRWKEPICPTAGRQYDVELTVPGVLVWGVDVVKSLSHLESLRSERGEMHLIVTLQSLSEDRSAAVRLGDSVILLDLLGVAVPEGTLLEVRVPELELYDTHS